MFIENPLLSGSNVCKNVNGDYVALFQKVCAKSQTLLSKNAKPQKSMPWGLLKLLDNNASSSLNRLFVLDSRDVDSDKNNENTKLPNAELLSADDNVVLVPNMSAIFDDSKSEINRTFKKRKRGTNLVK